MKTLSFDAVVYDVGTGWIFRKVMNVTLPGLILASLEMAVIKTG